MEEKHWLADGYRDGENAGKYSVISSDFPSYGHVLWKMIPRDKGWIWAPSRNDSGEPIDKLHLPSDSDEKANLARTVESSVSTGDKNRKEPHMVSAPGETEEIDGREGYALFRHRAG